MRKIALALALNTLSAFSAVQATEANDPKTVLQASPLVQAEGRTFETLYLSVSGMFDIAYVERGVRFECAVPLMRDGVDLGNMKTWEAACGVSCAVESCTRADLQAAASKAQEEMNQYFKHAVVGVFAVSTKRDDETY